MSSAIIYANQPKVFSLWDDHKNVLRELYLTKKMNLKDVKKVMESDYGFPTTFTYVHADDIPITEDRLTPSSA